MLFLLLLFFFSSTLSFSQIIDTIDLSSNNKNIFKPSLRPSSYNRTEIITKYTLEQFTRNIIIKEKSKIYNDWDIRYILFISSLLSLLLFLSLLFLFSLLSFFFSSFLSSFLSYFPHSFFLSSSSSLDIFLYF